MRVFLRRTLPAGVLVFPDTGAALAQQMSQAIPPAASTLNSGDTAWMLTSTALVLMQFYALVAVAAYDAIASMVLLKLVDLTIGLRVDSGIDREGLDLAIHGEAVQ